MNPRFILVAIFLLASAPSGAEKLAVTFDDLSLNGALAPNTTRLEIATDVLDATCR